VKRGLAIIGILVAVMGIVFFFQGIGLLKGSIMTDDNKWAVIGAICAVGGVTLMVWGNKRPQGDPPVQ